MFQKMNSATYWQSENTTRSPGVITYPQFVTFDMTKVFMVQNILAIFISPNDNPIDLLFGQVKCVVDE